MDGKTAEDEAPPREFIAQNSHNAQRNHPGSKPGQQNLDLVKINLSSDMPSAIHHVMERGLPTSTDVAAVDMRLTSGSFRELHWHLTDE